MRAVNLLPKGAYAPKQRLPHARLVLAGTLPLLAGALVFLGYTVEHAKVVDRENQLGTVQAQIAALGPSHALVEESARVGAEKASRAAAVQAVLDRRVAWDVLLPRLARVTPGGSWYTSVTASSPTPSTSAPAAPTTTTSTASTTSSAAPAVTLLGYAPTQEVVAQLLERLTLVPGVGNVTLVSATKGAVGAKTLVQFSINASLAGSGS